MAIDSTGLDLAALGLRSSTETTGVKKNELGQEAFLELMITQFKNQDPFKPLDNGEFLSQLAQFSSVAGLTELKQSFEDLSASLVSNQALQASSLLGRKVLVAGDTVALSAGGTIEGAIDLTTGAQSLKLQVVDASGAIVREMNLGAQNAGLVSFSWDGKTQDGSDAPAGVYTLKAQAVNGSTSQEAMETLIEDTVQSVTMGAGQAGLTLSLPKLGDTALSDVRQIS